MTLAEDGRPTTTANTEFGDKFRYWKGSSGKRYLFSSIPLAKMKEFQSGILILTRIKMCSETDILWVGTVNQGQLKQIAGQMTYHQAMAEAQEANIHLLHDKDGDEAAIIDDIVNDLKH
jgi:acetoacetate decarboxylase